MCASYLARVDSCKEQSAAIQNLIPSTTPSIFGIFGISHPPRHFPLDRVDLDHYAMAFAKPSCSMLHIASGGRLDVGMDCLMNSGLLTLSFVTSLEDRPLDDRFNNEPARSGYTDSHAFALTPGYAPVSSFFEAWLRRRTSHGSRSKSRR